MTDNDLVVVSWIEQAPTEFGRIPDSPRSTVRNRRSAGLLQPVDQARGRNDIEGPETSKHGRQVYGDGQWADQVEADVSNLPGSRLGVGKADEGRVPEGLGPIGNLIAQR